MNAVLKISVVLLGLILLVTSIGMGWLRRETATSGWLVFETSDAMTQHLYRMDADGTNLRQISPNIYSHWEYPRWSPDGHWILAAENTTQRMYALRPYGNAAIQAIDSDNFAGITMRWSPDSNQIIYTSFFERYMNVHVAFLGGDPSTRLTNFGEYRNGNAIWSPDGRRVAFLSDRSSVTEIYQMDTNGENLTRLTTDSNVQVLIGWSPEGGGLYYLNYLNQIVYISMDATLSQRIIVQEHGRITGADLSPDGKRLVYVIVFREGIQQQQSAYEVQTDGSKRRQVLSDIENPNDLVWSADGQWLAFTAEIEGYQQIFRARLDNSVVEQLTFEPRNHTNPDWSPVIEKSWTWNRLLLLSTAIISIAASAQLFTWRRK